MRCSACSTENPPQAKFCLECGAPLARRCSACGTLLPDVAKFCLECGQAIPAAGVAPTPSIAPQTYTPQHLAAKILAGRDALTGERKQVTVLFADVVGSTELIHGRDPEDAQRLLDGAVERMMGAIHRYEGTVSRLMGDGLMAMFGAPVAHEDHAVRACYAALAMLEAVQTYANEARQSHGEALQIRMGLNSGEVIVRLISDDLHMDYTAMGETVHLASRMESLARPGTAVLTPTTLALVEGYVQVQSLGPMPVRGLAEPIDTYRLVGAGQAQTRLQASAARGLTRFVGRQREIEAVETALERAQAGHGQVVGLVGEPGMGKSRLVYEVTHGAGADGWLVLQSGSVSYGKATPYLPAVGLLKSYSRIESGDDAEAIRQRLSDRLLTLDRALEPILTPLLSLLDVPVEDPSWAVLDPPGRRRAILDAIKRLVLRQSQQQPLLLVFEDLHWVDEQTQALLDALVEIVPAARLLLLVNFRPEYTHGWGNKSYYTQLHVDPLGERSADELLSGLIGDDASVQPLKSLLIGSTDGNPFFLEESVRSLVEIAVLVGERGAYELTRPVESIRVPATVQAVLAARIDRLPPEEKRLLQTASVIGKDVPLVLLQAIADLPEGDLQASLSRLQAAELLYAVSLYPERELTFKHALTQEVAYGSLLQERRRPLHARIVQAIERFYPDRLDEQAERLAQHAFRGQCWESAVTYARRAGLKAVGRSAQREAVASYEQALAALAHLPSRRETVELAVDLRLEFRAALAPFGDVRRMLAMGLEAESLAESLHDELRIGRSAALLASCRYLIGDTDAALTSAERAYAIAMTLADVDLEAGATHYLGMANHTRGNYTRAADALARSMELIDGPVMDAVSAGKLRPGPWYPVSGGRHYLTWSLAELGRFDEGAVRADEGIRFGDTVQYPFTRLLAQLGAGVLALRKGEHQAAISVLERGLDISRAAQLGTLGYYNLVAFQASALTQTGHADEALPMLEQIVEQSASHGVMSDHLLALTPLGEALLAVDRVSDAREVATRAVELSQKLNQGGQQAYALRLMAETQHALGSDEAESSYRLALALAEDLGMRPLRAHCRLGLGKLYRRVGRVDEAHAELTAAITMLRDMGMAHWLPEAEAELAQVDVSALAKHVG